jgi:3-phosphoshikimate 1-carboxyvinyltransferase
VTANQPGLAGPGALAGSGPASVPTQPAWPAPVADCPVAAVVRLPGSKSVTNRALVLAALAGGRSVLTEPLRSRDTLLMAAGLRALGVPVRDLDPPAGAAAGQSAAGWVVDGVAGPLHPTAPRVDTGNAGTVARFLPPIAALATTAVTFDGDPRMRERPLGPLLAALRALGVNVDDGGRGRLPVQVRGRGAVPGGAVILDASGSSQLVSGLLLAGARYDAGVAVRHDGPPVPSAAHLAMTVAMLRAAGAVVHDVDPQRWCVQSGPLRARDWAVEPDLSSAAAFLAAAMVTAGRVRVPGWPADTTQPGAVLPELLSRMGARWSLAADGLELTGPATISGIDADLRDCGELAPVLAAVAALASTPSRLRGIAHLRLQETDRLAALARELGRLGGDVRETADGLEIRPRPLHGGPVATYADHRLAMAAAVLGLVVPGVLVEDVATTAKTVPDFVDRWAGLLAGRSGAAD